MCGVMNVMLKRFLVLGIGLWSMCSASWATNSLDLLNSESKGIKFQAKHISVGSAYEAQVKDVSFKEHLDSLSYRSSYSADYLKLIKTYEAFLKEKSSRDDWARYSPVLSMAYPDPAGRIVVANLQLDVPSFYQVIIFSHDTDKDKYTMRDRFVKRIMEQNCKRLETGISRYNKGDWKEYMDFVRDLSNTITFRFNNGTSMTLLTTCPNINWSEYQSVM